MNTIKCKNCGVEIEIDRALEDQVKARVSAVEKHKYEEELARVKQEEHDLANKQLEGEKELLKKQAAADLELEKKKLAQAAANELRKNNDTQETLIKSLRDDAEAARSDAKKLREEQTEMLKLLREEKQARANAELDAQKKLLVSEDKIREEVLKSADEKNHLKNLEYEKKIADMQKTIEEAHRKGSQGSQQNQGEVLEQDLENRLREEFPLDDIGEVKKGQRGADIIQTIKNQNLSSCGILLWETKNGKWQPAWVPKFKQDIREANANIGIIVSRNASEYGDMKRLVTNVWVVKPILAPVLAIALRNTIVQVDVANRNSEGKDAKMEVLYQFLVGPEFQHRIEAIVENYSMLQEEMEKEKRSTQLRWTHQDKAIRAVIDNTIGMYGDLQGITNRALPSIKTLELPDGE